MQHKLSGVKDPAVRPYETEHRAIARAAAADGMVLLKNENNLLPIAEGTPLALYGFGTIRPVKGGSGSGDVNARETVNIADGLAERGYPVVNQAYLASVLDAYDAARLAWKDEIWKKVDANATSDTGVGGLFMAYASTPFTPPAGGLPEKEAADIAIYTLTRTAGEGADRSAAPGDYYLTEGEEETLALLNELYPHVALLLNVGGVVDLSFLDRYPHIEAVLLVGQPGMDCGRAVADVISGDVNPSGKLTDTWALKYEDYPNSATFSHNNGNVEHEYYEEGIFVGYRYFDTFEVPVRYGFGFGLSYTSFSIEVLDVDKLEAGDAPHVLLTAAVKNEGTRAGREVVQVYSCPPETGLMKEYRRLVGYRKTKLLAPGEIETLKIEIPLYALASYDDVLPGWVLEGGIHGLFVGNSLESSRFEGSVRVEETLVFEKTEHICPLKEELHELKADTKRLGDRRAAWMPSLPKCPHVFISSEDVEAKTAVYGPCYEDTPKAVRDFVDTLSLDQLVLLATGDAAAGQGSELGSAGSRVPGSAAQTSPCAEEQGLEDIVLADGPAGLRLDREYEVLNGVPVKAPFTKAIENGFLYRESPEEAAREKGELYYQYCTAIPVGTVLAQTWDPKTVAECGRLVAEEMRLFGVASWLAPGMNIHRNPLCGRNFEYYSEDPVLAGTIAAAMTDGVQLIAGCGTTIKHFCCNNQEDNRMGSDSVVSERALREIYLKGFEIAVKTSQPMFIMTSYNLVNGVHAANNYDLCTKAARCEWGFKGMIMTDWTTTNKDETCTASGCMRAGNDIVMPGMPMDHDNIRAELEAGTLSMADLKRSIARVVNAVWRARVN